MSGNDDPNSSSGDSTSRVLPGDEASHSLTPRTIYCIAIGGTGMAPLACLLQGQGHRVRGADGPLYPPMSTLLAEAGIEPLVGYDPAHLDPAPDLVIVGNAVPRTNPEAEAVESRGLPRISMPQALARFFLSHRRPLVIAGTHGKTTTTAMAAWVYCHCGADPGYLIGGLPKGLPGSFQEGSGDRFIIEGDEYNAAYFDRGPKFLHYQPQTLVLTSAEYDHADLYPSPEALLAAYRSLVELVPEDGLLIACGDWPAVRELGKAARSRVLTYGLGTDCDLHPIGPLVETAQGTSFTLDDPEAGRIEVHLPCWGGYNVTNALAVWAAARADGIPAERVAEAFAAFQGVARRQDELGSPGGVTVVDDFAHHPTAIAKTLKGLAARYDGRPLTVLYEPRSLTAGRAFFQDAYLEAFQGAQRVLFGPIFHEGRLSDDERLDLDRLVDDLNRAGVDARSCASNEDVLATAVATAREGDVLVTMSSGSFDGMPHRLAEALGAA